MVDHSLAVAMRQEGIRCYPNEACGLLVKQGKKSLALACRNMSSTPEHHFLIDPEDYSRAADQGEVIGVWHTHVEVSAQPSEADLAGCEASELVWYITSVRKSDDEFFFEDVVVVEPSGYEQPYLERPYVFGVLDCYSLVRDYYKREFDISLNDAPRVEEWWKKGHNFFEERFAGEGFVQLIDQQPQIGDVFLLQCSADVPNHVVIYIGDDMILHHSQGRLSKRDIYGGYWKKHTSHHLRHRAKC